MNPFLTRITVEPTECGGRPCIRGYRLRVKDVLELLAHGASLEEILSDYKFLEAVGVNTWASFVGTDFAFNPQ